MNTQTVVNAATNTGAPAVQGKQTAKGTAKGGNGGQAEFMQMLQNMLYGQAATGEGTLQQVLQAQLTADTDKEGTEKGAEMLAQLLATSPSLASILPMLLTNNFGEQGDGSGIMQMVSGLQSGTSTATATDLAQLLAGLTGDTPQVKADGSTQSTKVCDNLLAQLMAGQSSANTPAQPQQNGTVANVVPIASTAINAQVMPVEVQASVVQGTKMQETTVQNTLPNAKVETPKADAAVSEAEQLAQGNASFVKAVASAKTGTGGEGQNSTAQHSDTQGDEQVKLEGTMSTAKQESAKVTDSKADETDITKAEGSFADRLAPAIDRPQDTVSTAPIGKQALLAQVTKGAIEKANAGQEDFTLKLTPEGLGEITVKLANVHGRITMQLTASDTNVQKLLASELDALKEAMKPYKVEVQEVRSQEQRHFNFQGNAQDAQQQHNELAARFAFAKEQQSNNNQYYYGGGQGADADEQGSTEPISKLSSYTASSIDRYI